MNAATAATARIHTLIVAARADADAAMTDAGRRYTAGKVAGLHTALRTLAGAPATTTPARTLSGVLLGLSGAVPAGADRTARDGELSGIVAAIAAVK